MEQLRRHDFYSRAEFGAYKKDLAEGEEYEDVRVIHENGWLMIDFMTAAESTGEAVKRFFSQLPEIDSLYQEMMHAEDEVYDTGNTGSKFEVEDLGVGIFISFSIQEARIKRA